MANNRYKSQQDEKYKIDFRYNLRLYAGLLKKYKGILAVILILTLIMQASQVLDRYLFKEVVDRGTEFIAGTLPKESFIARLVLVATIFVSVALFMALSRWLNMHLINRLDSSLMRDLKRKFFNHLIHLSYNFHTTHKTGSLISKLIRSSGAVERLTDVMIFDFVPMVFQIILASLSLLYFDAVSAVIVVAVIVLFMGFSLFINRIQEDSSIVANNTEDYEKGHISDIFTNIDSIKFFGKEFHIKSNYAKIGENTKKFTMKNWDHFRWLSLGHSLILSAGIFCIVYFPATKVLAGTMSIGTLVFIYTTFGGLFHHLFAFDHGLRNFYKSMADFESLFKYAKISNEIKDKGNAPLLKISHGSVEFRNVTFRYKNRYIFRNFSLKVPDNKKVALVGPSGSGKTTLVRLLYRFFDAEKGKILIDGKDIRDFQQESLRSELSIVPQECVLFDETIYNNIKFSSPKAKKNDVMQAIRFAQLDRIIKDFPSKENTVVGERGVKLSGGEKQRVSIARAILANKKILVLDEATSSLDSETESQIQRALQELMKGRTSIIIAHRLSTIMRADIIVVLDRGRIVQKGTHRQLIKKEGLYKKLWNLQKGGYLQG